ncbi:MAG: extracellular solute-binding protein [Anaerolineae bacterium]|nr:extracellular solute-binding protein [Anaerolineae bacterium]
MKSKLLSLIVLVTLVGGLFLTACGPTEAPATTIAPATTAAVTEAPTEVATEVATEPTATAEPEVEPTAEGYSMVVLPGTFQKQLGCDDDWMPDCDKAALTLDNASGMWKGTFNIMKGVYEYKVAANGGWDINFGKEGVAGGDNLALVLTTDAPVNFSFDPATHLLTVESEGIDDTPPAASAEGSLVIWADETRVPALQSLAEAFKAEYGIDIVVEQLAFGDIRDIFAVAAPAGEGPDIIIGAHDWLGELAASGLLAPIDLGDKIADFSPAAVQAFTYQGELYGMPNAIENVAFFRNVDLVPDAPETWDEVLSVSKELAKDNGEDLEANQYGFVRMEGDPYHFFPIQTAFGGYIFGYNEDRSWDPTNVGLDSEGSIAAAQWYADLITNKLQPPAMDSETMVSWFEKGKAAMIITGPWNLPRIKESGVNYAISNIPSATEIGRPFLGAQGFMINAFSKEPLLAQVFLVEFVATTETMQAFYDSQPRPPVYLPFMQTLDDPDQVAFSQAGAQAVPMPAIPEMSAVWDAWTNALVLIAQNGDDPASAFTNAAQQIRDAISKE